VLSIYLENAFIQGDFQYRAEASWYLVVSRATIGTLFCGTTFWLPAKR